MLSSIVISRTRTHAKGGFMYQFPIGVVVESFRKEIHEAIKEASK